MIYGTIIRLFLLFLSIMTVSPEHPGGQAQEKPKSGGNEGALNTNGSAESLAREYQAHLDRLIARINADPNLETAEKEKLSTLVTEAAEAALAPLNQRLEKLRRSETAASAEKRAQLQEEGAALIRSFEATLNSRLTEASDSYLIADSEFKTEVEGSLAALTTLMKDRGANENPELAARYLNAYNAMETAVPDEKQRLEWTDVIVTATKTKDRSTVALVLTIIQDESGFASRPWRDQAQSWSHDLGIGEAPKTYGPFQLHIDTAREMAVRRGEYTNDEALIKTLENDKSKAMSYFLEQLGKITELYTDRTGQITQENFTFIRADYLSGPYSSKNSALQKQLVSLGYLPPTYTPEGWTSYPQSSIDGDLGRSSLDALVRFAQEKKVLDEKKQAYTREGLSSRYFGQYSDRMSFEKSPLYIALCQSYKAKTGSVAPSAYLTERKTKGGFYSTADSVARSAVIFDEYRKKIL